MTSALKLLRTEFRRNLGLLLFVPLLAVAWWMSASRLGGVYIWLDTGAAIWESVLFTGPLMGGIAAWMAGRNERRRVTEMLAITPRPPAARDLTTWAGTALWGVAAYALITTALFALTWRNATWGGPLWGYAVAGLVAVLACSAAGYAAGHWLPSRLTAPLIVMVLLLALGMPATTAGREPNLELLSPVPLALLNSMSVFYEAPRVTPQQLLWPLGLTGVALAAVALKSGGRRAIPAAALLGCAAVAMVGLFASAGDARPTGTPLGEPVPFEYVCRDGAVTVCVHPAYEELLPASAREINRVAEPIAGLPGVPARATQVGPFGPSGTVSGENGLTFNMHAMRSGQTDWFKYQVLNGLLWSGSGSTMIEPAEPTAEDRERCGEVWKPDPEEFPGVMSEAYQLNPAVEAMGVVEEWLIEHSGAQVPEASGPPQYLCSNIDSLVERFSELDPAERRAWLEDNFAGLRAGEVTLEDLP